MLQKPVRLFVLIAISVFIISPPAVFASHKSTLLSRLRFPFGFYPIRITSLKAILSSTDSQDQLSSSVTPILPSSPISTPTPTATPAITPAVTISPTSTTIRVTTTMTPTATPTPASSVLPSPTSVSSNSKVYYVSPAGDDQNDGLTLAKALKTIQKAFDKAEPGDTVKLSSGTYRQDFISKRNGSKDKPITLTGPSDAVVKGGGKTRVVEINHDFITLFGFTLDGLFGSSDSASSYRDKLLYVQGKESKNGVTGLKVSNMTFKNAGGECIRLRYFAQDNEIERNTITNCGVHDFRFNAGGKNGEGIYIGTAPEQLGDGKNPTSDPDQSNNNWIHHNKIETNGNECVDIKESSGNNLIEYNRHVPN